MFGNFPNMLARSRSRSRSASAVVFLCFCLSTLVPFQQFPVAAVAWNGVGGMGSLCMMAALWVDHGLCEESASQNLRGKARPHLRDKARDVEGNSVLPMENPAKTGGGSGDVSIDFLEDEWAPGQLAPPLHKVSSAIQFGASVTGAPGEPAPGEQKPSPVPEPVAANFRWVEVYSCPSDATEQSQRVGDWEFGSWCCPSGKQPKWHVGTSVVGKPDSCE